MTMIMKIKQYWVQSNTLSFIKSNFRPKNDYVRYRCAYTDKRYYIVYRKSNIQYTFNIREEYWHRKCEQKICTSINYVLILYYIRWNKIRRVQAWLNVVEFKLRKKWIFVGLHEYIIQYVYKVQERE